MKSILVAASLANLHPGHAVARDIIICALDARLDGRPALDVPFAQLTTLLVQHHPPPLLDAPLSHAPLMAPPC
jgi:hypothetical protein